MPGSRGAQRLGGNGTERQVQCSSRPRNKLSYPRPELTSVLGPSASSAPEPLSSSITSIYLQPKLQPLFLFGPPPAQPPSASS
mmetsp:Transcript_1271/g.2117  ORF Transcript_1271/g.2117 Transcript_1271/m.2117 type:complete len:83 (+) Transcript_1271:267-515(+)